MAQYYIFSVNQMIYVANGADGNTVQGLSSVTPPNKLEGEVEALNYMVNTRGLTLVQVVPWSAAKEYYFTD